MHVDGNIYVVLTPFNAGGKSIIEDCFAPAIRNLNLGGKTFSPNNNADSSLYFGKHILSQYVRDNAAKIDFTGFAVLLDRISEAIEAHKAKQAVAAHSVIP
jgi:hypothetical protein